MVIEILIGILTAIIYFLILILAITLEHYFYYFVAIFYIKRWKHFDKSDIAYIITNEKNTLIYDKKNDIFYLYYKLFNDTTLTTLSSPTYLNKFMVFPYLLFKYYKYLITKNKQK